MYTLVRRFIKTGIAFLFLGLLLGAWMLVQRDLLGIWPNPYLVSAHAHAVLVGFVMFMILGVALWLFPRAPQDDQRYRPGRAAAAYWVLLIATAGRFVAEAAKAWFVTPALGWVVVPGRIRPDRGARHLLLGHVVAHPGGRQPLEGGQGRAILSRWGETDASLPH